VILVYLIPVVGFLAGYFIGYIIQAVAVCSVAGFLLGWLPALLYNRHIKKKPPTYFIVGFVEDSYRN
jgi:positive regulator of sigma E activity